MKNILLTISLLVTCFQFSVAQKMSWRDYSDLAEKSYKNQDYGTAAKNFKAAWQKKKSKLELLYKAGQSYYLVKNYKESANAFEKVAKKSSKFPTSTLEYARALKQDGAYEKSIEAFESYIKAYKNEDKPQQTELVKREIEGCNLAMGWIKDSSSSAYKIKYPGQVINTSFTDFAPIPFGENVLYFSSNRKGKAKIYKSEWDGSSWSKPSSPTIFPKDEKEHFGNGSFSSDFNRFYYTKCKEVEGKNGLTSKCDIYVIIKKGDKWTEPLKLRDYINDSIATSTQPSVSKFGNKEVLYFSSNRSGGYGGQDIWYCERDLSGDDIDFTVPKNCGPKINTFGDEVTPWYDVLEGRLYYSSTGHIGAGGLDIYNNQGIGKDWKEANNLGFPANSPADDFYFIKCSNLSSGYLVSNRTFGDLKKSTDNEDIFKFDYTNFQNIFSGKVFDGKSDNPLKDARITIYEQFPDGNETLVDNRYCPDGSFAFALDASKNYKAKIEKFDYAPQFYRFVTSDKKGSKINQDFILEKEKEASLANTDVNVSEKSDQETIIKEQKQKVKKSEPVTKPEKKSEPTKPVAKLVTKPKPESNTTESYVQRPPSFFKEGQYYMIQLAAARYPDLSAHSFQEAKKYGTLENEPVPDKEMERVLLAWWADRKEAIKALASVKKLGFSGAFITLHERGVRQSIIK